MKYKKIISQNEIIKIPWNVEYILDNSKNISLNFFFPLFLPIFPHRIHCHARLEILNGRQMSQNHRQIPVETNL